VKGQLWLFVQLLFLLGRAAAAQTLPTLCRCMLLLQDICKKYNIPTAAYESFTDPAAAKAYIQQQGAPIVVKTSGLAAGKGVIVAQSVEEACQAVDDMMVNSVFGDAGES
jgi:phosphoribosylamine-glycine ligase